MVNRIDGRRRIALAAAVLALCAASAGHPVSVLQAEEQAVSADTASQGQYTVPDGWSEDTSAGQASGSVYRYSENVGVDGTSSITCQYMETNYMVSEYEQLRDMLTNDILYSRVNAEISTNAAYTDSRDYLYILTADDPSLAYREIFYYVVGDLKCFCVTVREYRSEAEDARAAQKLTPEEAGKQIASAFTWL